MRSQRRRSSCRKCERPREECGELSARGLCASCGLAGFLANVERGGSTEAEWWDRWREGVARSIGVRLDD